MEDLDLSVANAIRVLSQTVQEICLRRNIEEACPTPLNHSQFMILNLLCAGRNFSVGEIARVLQVTPPAICRAVDRLKQLDLVERRTRAEDHRTHDVVLLPAGSTLMDRFVAISVDRQERTLACFDRHEKEQLLALLRRLVLSALEGEKDTEVICLQCIDRGGEHCVLPDHDTRCLRRREN
jgi:DNA-binding MarR family transcriptional regulator